MQPGISCGGAVDASVHLASNVHNAHDAHLLLRAEKRLDAAAAFDDTPSEVNEVHAGRGVSHGTMNSRLMRRRSLREATTLCSRRRVGRRVTKHKVTKAELAIRKELMRALMSIRGKHIDDVFPPSGQDPSLIPCCHSRSANPGRSTSSQARGRNTMARKPTTAGARRTARPVPQDEEAIREELLQALMSIRGKHIEDVYPPSSADDEVHA